MSVAVLMIVDLRNVLTFAVLAACSHPAPAPRVPHQARPFSYTAQTRCVLPFVAEYEDAPDGDDGFLRGTVADSRGELAVGATVVVTGRGLVGEKMFITDETGMYQIGALPPGRYELAVYYQNREGYHPLAIHAGVVTVDHVHDADKGCPMQPSSCGWICAEPAPVPLL